MKKVRNKLLLIGSVLSSTTLFAMSASCANNSKEEKPEKPSTPEETPSNPDGNTNSDSNLEQPETPSNPEVNNGENSENNPEKPVTPEETPSNPTEESGNSDTNVEQPVTPSNPEENNGENSENNPEKPVTPEETPSNPTEESGNSDTNVEQPETPSNSEENNGENPESNPETPVTPEETPSNPTEENNGTNEKLSTVLRYIYDNQEMYSLEFLMSEGDEIGFINIPEGYTLTDQNAKIVAGKVNEFQIVKIKKSIKLLKKSPVVNKVTSDESYLGLSYNNKNRVETLAFINPNADPVYNRSLSENDKTLIYKLVNARAELISNYFKANEELIKDQVLLKKVSVLNFIDGLKDEMQKVNRLNLSSYIFTIDFLLSDEKYLTDANVEFVLGNKEKVAAMKDGQVQFSNDSNVEIFNRKMKIAGIK
ncbi:hypothetical protein [Mycoplasma anserisalpingitidis]|uniref:hypothetical protein n=1 Tax=Mycoplasma anserisalpingitidis TaxID=519450 RepID=UPI0011B1540E|nr:hypothetical protein [Mycoplasma anserisalpingitidis]QDY87360.1 hypothetical protein FOY45_00215 [Mycoplasma anserisalpingitidis]